jgi:hypothetical protein
MGWAWVSTIFPDYTFPEVTKKRYTKLRSNVEFNLSEWMSINWVDSK